MSTWVKPRGSYGIDAPWVPILWFALGIAFTVIGIINIFGADSAGVWILVIIDLVLAVVWFAGGALYLYATNTGKFVIWRGIADGANLTGAEKALDVGCGRGAVLVEIGRRVPRGTVTGIDLWRSIDQSGNGPEATTRNLELNQVTNATLDTGDMTGLPYPDESFEFVTASISIHNIGQREGRQKAVREIIRVLAPGGRLAIVDIQRVPEYAQILRESGLTITSERGAGWRMWWSGPWMATRVITATKPL